jgi:hypothetical protein
LLPWRLPLPRTDKILHGPGRSLRFRQRWIDGSPSDRNWNGWKQSTSLHCDPGGDNPRLFVLATEKFRHQPDFVAIEQPLKNSFVSLVPPTRSRVCTTTEPTPSRGGMAVQSQAREAAGSFWSPSRFNSTQRVSPACISD